MMSDPIADMLARIRNAQMAGKKTVSFPNSKMKYAILEVLKREGFVDEFSISDNSRDIDMQIKYYIGTPVIGSLKRYSRPGLRRYSPKDSIPLVQNGLGISILSTSKGVMSDHQARAEGVGGEILCEIS